MLAIRLQRNGRTHHPVYRIIVQEAQRHPLSGRVVAEVGRYNPETKETILDKEKIEFYLKNGARPSTRLIRILKAEKISLPAWVKDPLERHYKAKHADKLRKNQPKEPTEAAEPTEAPANEATTEAPATEAPAEPVTEAPAEQAEAPTAK